MDDICKLCGDPINEEKDFCTYCRLPNVIILGEAAEEANERNIIQHREKILNNISEIGVVLQRYQSIQNEKVVCKEEQCPLFFPNNANKRNIRENVFYGKEISLYYKTKKNEVIKFPKAIELMGLPKYDPKAFFSFEISAKINEQLKLDVFCHVNNGFQDGLKPIDNLKLGETLKGLL